MDQVAWSITTLHTEDQCELVQGDPELVLGVSGADFGATGLAGRVIGEQPEPCPWQVACESSVYLIRQSGGQPQWVESRSVATGGGTLLVSTRTAGPADTLPKLAALGRVAMAGSLLGPLAHEVNNIVQGLSAATFLLEDMLTQGDAIEPEFLADVNGVVVNLANIGQALHSFGSQVSTEAEYLSPMVVVEACAGLLRQSGKLTTVEFTLHSTGALPDLKWPKAQLEYVVLALLCNAADAARRSETTQSVRVDLSASKTEVLLDIHDTGGGFRFAEAIRPYVSDGPKHRNLGLGLSIASTLLAANGGKIAVEASAEGSVVRVGFALEEAGG